MVIGDGSLSRIYPTDRQVSGRLALGFLMLLSGGALFGLVYEAIVGSHALPRWLDARIWGVVRFTVWQAAWSTALSVVPALAVARAVSRHPVFPGRALLLRLFAVPLALPALVAALGVLALYGRSGLLAEVLSIPVEGRWPGIYGLSGILIAHAFFNLPLATRLFLEALRTIPDDHWRLASQLGMGAGAQWKIIEWPVLRNALPGVASLVLMLCITSFTIVLTLGGGPAATTLEVAIYQSLRFDFDPGLAVVLTILQVGLTAALVTMLTWLGGQLVGSRELVVTSRRFGRPGPLEAGCNGLVIVVAALFVIGPMMAVVVSGLNADLARLAGEVAVQRAIATSLILSFLAALLAVWLSYALVATRKSLEMARTVNRHPMLARLSDHGSQMILAFPPIVLGAGWFILLRHVGDVFLFAPVMVVTVNAAMAMPFVVRAIRPAYDRASDRYDHLAASLGMKGLAKWRLVDWPVLKSPLLTGFAFAMALSLGDLGVIALFGSESVQTLPYLLLARLSSYRTADAAGLALFLGLLTLALMLVAGRRDPVR